MGVLEIQTPRGGRQNAKRISESALYKLVMRSDKPEAKKFQAWVTETVLPAIRKEGGHFCENCVSVFDRECLPEIPPVGHRSLRPMPYTANNMLTGYTSVGSEALASWGAHKG